jgi:hypothetical protein
MVFSSRFWTRESLVASLILEDVLFADLIFLGDGLEDVM